MNLPNKITLTRILLIPVFLICILPLPEILTQIECINWINELLNNYGAYIAVGIFAVASITDALDGYIARKHNLTTDLGALLDPVADKLLVSSALITLTTLRIINPWITIIVIAREFIITGFRLIAIEKKLVVPANIWGKIKTSSQIALIFIALIILAIGNSTIYVYILNFTSIAVLISTIYSGWAYISENKKIINTY